MSGKDQSDFKHVVGCSDVGGGGGVGRERWVKG